MKKTNNWFYKIWNDSVWSKVIAGVILGVGGVVYSFVKSLFEKDVKIGDVLKEVFGLKVNLWIAIAVVLVIWIIVSAIKSKRAKANKVPVTPFVNDFNEGWYQGLQWKWRWQWSESQKIYYLTDLNLVCPNCKDGLLTAAYLNYRCGKCGAELPFGYLNADQDAVKTQILADARQKYSYCEEYIGEIKSGYMKA